MASTTVDTPAPTTRTPRIRSTMPGVAVALAAAVASMGVGLLVPGLSAMLVAIILGVVAANTGLVRAPLTPGISFAAKHLLRAGIVLLGLQLVLGDIVALGAPMLLVVLAIVTGGIFGTLALGRLFGVPRQLRLLIACGFSICGAAAVAGAAGVTDPDDKHEHDTVTAVALVVIFGTIMIFAVPGIATLMGLDARTAGMWGGGATHEIAQVVAIGGVLGGGALTAAVLVKLARVLMLAPVMAVLSIRARRNAAASAGQSAPKLPPIMPLFVVGFLATVLLRSFVPLPALALDIAGQLQTLLLAAAMFGLGCGVRIAQLRKVGARPFALAAASTLVVAGIAFGGVLIAS
ncbi:YeiH family protein [Gulosibacter sp. ACHW.36C]|uniref:Sulfate exporter family transporter n=1 Tax=Gulosibacter sediminis TaxID=1729695 RepID=A0ABY4MY09_9MICO|nr:putative sulfate exporter family transporter [Gulosibacter sediminis]UQN15321.1 putative sulfate exporter family transporter [Gulosibacter sediminis]